MKLSSIVMGMAGISIAAIVASTPASAWTCQERANECVRLARDPATKPKCSEAERMRVCASTGKYYAPSGRILNADVVVKSR